MQGQQMMGQGRNPAAMTMGPLTEQDMFHNILVLLKHTVREYATAATEANCAIVRQTMQRMLHETLSEQADCYQVMGRQGWYPPSPSATRQDVQKAVQTHRQCAQQTAQALQMSGIRPTLQSGAAMQNGQNGGMRPNPDQHQGQPSNQWQQPAQTGQAAPQWQPGGNPAYGQVNYQTSSAQPAFTNQATSGQSGAPFGALEASTQSSTVTQEPWRATAPYGQGETTH